MKEKIQIALNKQQELSNNILTNKEAIILASIYELTYRRLTKEDLAKVFGVSRERIRQLVARALTKINL
jgi:DNA-directed RNA polymerase sigma subunit (sigma70/sigma32)